MFQILIIDDTRSVHAFTKSLLNKAPDIQVSSAMNGAQGLEAIKANHFDLILLDWEMPVLNGPDTLEQIKKMNIETPVIMTTTRNSAEDIQRMLDAGVSEYMMKPFTIDILFEKISYVTGKNFPYAA